MLRTEIRWILQEGYGANNIVVLKNHGSRQANVIAVERQPNQLNTSLVVKNSACRMPSDLFRSIVLFPQRALCLNVSWLGITEIMERRPAGLLVLLDYLLGSLLHWPSLHLRDMIGCT